MNDITDFNDLYHRTASASARFQKGLYHLFMLSQKSTEDTYGKIIRTYQCLFELSATELLLDKDFSLSQKNILPRLKKKCKNPDCPTRKELDPASLITHTMLERQWSGFSKNHLLYDSSQDTLKLYRAVVEARHNLLYRPFMLDDLYWEDCTLIDLIGRTPESNDIKKAYQSFFETSLQWHKQERNSIAMRFIRLLFMPYEDQRDDRPTETLLISYARMLSPKDESLLNNIREYRNTLLNVPNLLKLSNIGILQEWKCGEL